MILRSRGVGLDAQQLGYLLVALAFYGVEVEHRSVAVGQLPQRLIDHVGREARRVGRFIGRVGNVALAVHEQNLLLFA